MPQWVQSWNAKGYQTLYTAIKDMEDGLTGYYVGTSANPKTDSQDVSSNAGYNDTLYFPDKTNAYWINSPSAYSDYGSNFVMTMYSNSDGHGGVGRDIYNNLSIGVRPVVCLKSNVKMTWNGNSWDLSN